MFITDVVEHPQQTGITIRHKQFKAAETTSKTRHGLLTMQISYYHTRTAITESFTLNVVHCSFNPLKK